MLFFKKLVLYKSYLRFLLFGHLSLFSGHEVLICPFFALEVCFDYSFLV